MNSDRLYELAFEYKATKLWKILWDTELFAVKLSDGNIGYISIMGAAAEHCALGLYIGEEGINSYHIMLGADRLEAPPFIFQELLMQQSCLQCAFECKSELSKEEYEEAKSYACKHGIRLSGKNAYPQFVKYQPNRCPWHLQTEREEENLCEALAAAIEIARLLEGRRPSELGLRSVNGKTKEIPLLERRDGAYVIGRTLLPEYKPKEVPKPKASNDIAITKLKKTKKLGIWECEIIRFFKPVQDDPEEIPVFPIVLLAVESSAEFMLPVPPVTNYEENPEELLNYFIDALVAQNICPIKIKVRDERTYAFAEALCRRLKIALSIEEDLPALDDAEDDFLIRFGMDDEEEQGDFLDMMDALLELDDKQLNTLPPEIVEQFGYLVQNGMLPKEMEERLEQVFRFQEDSEEEGPFHDDAGGGADKKAKSSRKVENINDIRNADKRKKEGNMAKKKKDRNTAGEKAENKKEKKE